MELRELLERLLRGGEDVSAEEAYLLGRAIAAGSVCHTQLAALLALLSARGETADLVFGLARALREHAIAVDVAAAGCDVTSVLDIVGTGGDGHNSVNISTAAAVTAAAGGCTTAKHGSVSVSSRSGAADVLLHLGVPHLAPHQIGPCLKDAGVAFMFAQKFHPALAAVAPVRRALKFRTVFNVLGPLINPAGAKRLVMGVFAPRLLPLYADAAARLGAEHALIVHCELPAEKCDSCSRSEGTHAAAPASVGLGEAAVPAETAGPGTCNCVSAGGLDELSPAGINHVIEVVKGAVVRRFTIDAGDFAAPHGGPVPRCTVADLEGGTPEDNAAIIKHVFAGEAVWGDAAAVAALPAVGKPPRSPSIAALAQAIALNAGACLYVCGRPGIDSIESGYAAAMQLLRSGAPAATLLRWSAVATALAAAGDAPAAGAGSA